MKIGIPSLLATLALTAATPRAQELLSGPMVGHTTNDSTRIWVEADRPVEVKVRYWLEPRVQYSRSLGEPIVLGVAEGRTTDSPPYTGTVELKDLRPGWLVYYEIELDDRPIRPATPQVFSLFPGYDESDTDTEFTVALASCAFPARVPEQPIWRQISRHRPTALLLIGDSNYMPNHPGAYETSEEVVAFAMARYHRYFRDLPGLRALLATTPTYGIWDDHDFGPNNSDRTFRWRDLSLALFRQYYPNPSAGLLDVPGVFTSFSIADVDFFLLDDRYHRDPNDAPDRQTMLGPGQLEWLKQSLVSSRATFKVVVNGGTMLVNRGGPGESWDNFGTERDDFLQWAFDQGITGLIFAAGDWHVGTLSRLHRPQDKYPLYELLSSNAGVTPPVPESNPIGLGHTRFHQFAGEEYRGFNFGLLRFSGPRNDRTVSLQIVDEHGQARIRLDLKEGDLAPKE